jgi:RHS repeat-associated protein
VAWRGERGFVDGTADASTGLTHLGAREYDPALGRFISVDPVLVPDEPQHLNAYAYANNSPVTMSDPDGRCWSCAGKQRGSAQKKQSSGSSSSKKAGPVRARKAPSGAGKRAPTAGRPVTAGGGVGLPIPVKRSPHKRVATPSRPTKTMSAGSSFPTEGPTVRDAITSWASAEFDRSPAGELLGHLLCGPVLRDICAGLSQLAANQVISVGVSALCHLQRKVCGRRSPDYLTIEVSGGPWRLVGISRS